MVLALLVPLAAGAGTAAARPLPTLLTIAAALLFAAAAWRGGAGGIVSGLAGVLGGASATLVLLRDPAIAGSAAAGFWLMVAAVWLAAALCVVQLAAIRSRS